MEIVLLPTFEGLCHNDTFGSVNYNDNLVIIRPDIFEHSSFILFINLAQKAYYSQKKISSLRNPIPPPPLILQTRFFQQRGLGLC